jgi:hypothetical protein
MWLANPDSFWLNDLKVETAILIDSQRVIQAQYANLTWADRCLQTARVSALQKSSLATHQAWPWSTMQRRVRSSFPSLS